MSEAMNFTFTVQKANDFGELINGSWNGVIGMLERKEAHIAIADLTIARERTAVVDFLPSSSEAHEGLYLKNPRDAFSISSYVGSFTKLAWIRILIWIIIAAMILTGLNWNKQHKSLS